MPNTVFAPTGSDPLLTAQQVADFLGASLRTIQRRIADGSIRTLKLGRIVRIPASEIGRLLDRDDRNPSLDDQALTKLCVSTPEVILRVYRGMEPQLSSLVGV